MNETGSALITRADCINSIWVRNVSVCGTLDGGNARIAKSLRIINRIRLRPYTEQPTLLCTDSQLVLLGHIERNPGDLTPWSLGRLGTTSFEIDEHLALPVRRRIIVPDGEAVVRAVIVDFTDGRY